MSRGYDLTEGSIALHIKNLAIPSSVGFFFHTMYNVVDTYFAGLLSTQALAALSLSFPVFFIIISASSGTSTGVTSVIANAIGSRDDEKSKIFAAQSITYGLIVSAFIVLLSYIFAPDIFSLLGAKGEYLSLSLAYMNIIILGAPVFILGSVFNSILTALGDTRSYRNFLILSFFLNVILDPWLLFGGFGVPALGISGIALATIIIQSFGCVYLFKKVSKTKLICGDTCAYLIPRRSVLSEIAYQCVPATVNMLLVAIGIFVLTYFVSLFGQSAVAAYGVATRIEQIALLPTIGLNMATLSIVGQNSGAKKFVRARQAWGYSLLFGYFVLMPGVFLVYVFAAPLMGFFATDSEVVTIGVEYLRIEVFVFWAYAILYGSVFALQGLKRPIYPLLIGFFRQILAPILLIDFLINSLNFGTTGIWWGIFSVTWFAALGTLFYTYSIFQKLIKA